jgi:hypothetical protein
LPRPRHDHATRLPSSTPARQQAFQGSGLEGRGAPKHLLTPTKMGVSAVDESVVPSSYVRPQRAEYLFAFGWLGSSGVSSLLSYPQKLCTWLSTCLPPARDDLLDPQYAGDANSRPSYFPVTPNAADSVSRALPVEALTMTSKQPKIAVPRGFTPFSRHRKVPVMCFTWNIKIGPQLSTIPAILSCPWSGHRQAHLGPRMARCPQSYPQQYPPPNSQTA